LGIASGSIGADLARTFLAAQISSPTPDLLLVSRGVLVRFQLLTPMRFLPNASPRVLPEKRVGTALVVRAALLLERSR
jgi:hypothetical protein